MSVIAGSIFSYAGTTYREDEARVVDRNHAERLRAAGFGYVEPLLGDGRTEVNRGALYADRCFLEASRAGLGKVGWFTPRHTSGVPIEETVQLAAEAVQRYGLHAVKYQCEAEFEFSNPSMGGEPGERFDAMAHLGAKHRELLPTIPTAVYARVRLDMADAWWTKAWQYGMRCFVECYGPTEGREHPGWAEPSAAGSALPPLVGGWFYRVRLGVRVYFGRLSDDAKTVVVDGQGTFPVGSSAGPRQIAGFGNAKWGAVLGFFPTSWIKITTSTYSAPGREKPTGELLASEIRKWKTVVRRYGDAPLGWNVYVGPEMTDDHYAKISPRLLTGSALLP